MAPSDVVAERVKEVRKRRDLTVVQLAQRCAELGASGLTEQALYNIEGGRPARKQGPRRRNVTVEELLVLAVALQVAPIHLLVPLDGEQPYQVTLARTERSIRARLWIRGTLPLDPADSRLFYSEVPDSEWDLYAGLRGDRDGERCSIEMQIRATRKVLEMLERRRDQEEGKSHG